MVDRRVRAAVLVGSGLWCLLIAAAAGLRLQFIYAFFSSICHQDPQRSWHLFGEPLAVCIRCTSIYCGFFVGCLLARRPSPKLLELAGALTLAEFLIARVAIDSAWLRAPSGFFLGIEAAPFVILGIQQMLTTRLRHAGV